MSILAATLRTLDLLPDMTRFRSDFSTRKVFQKVIYLLQEAGIHLGYSFGWYVSGPYSPSLADDGYEISTQEISGKKANIDPKAEEKVRMLFKDINLASEEAADYLELLASLHFMIRHAYPPMKSHEEAKETLRKSKPKFSAKDIDRALKTLTNAGLV